MLALGDGGLLEVAGAAAVIERYAPIVKAGRVLSSSNEAAIRAAADSLQKVLASLPAPIADPAEPVAKEKESTVDDTTTAPAAAPVTEVEKAKGDPQMAVFDESGKLVGTIDPADLSPIAAPAAPAADDDAAAADDAAPADEAPAAPAAAPAEDAAVIPGTDTVAAPAPTAQDDTVTKATHDAFSSALAEVLSPIAEQLAQHAELADVVKGLQERVAHLTQMPDDRKSPLLNGAVGDGLAPSNDPLVELRKAVEEADTPVAKAEAQQRLAYAAVRARFDR
jgi:hypothetical protein